MNQLEIISIAEYLDSSDSAETITDFTVAELSLTCKNELQNKKKNKSFVRLPEEVKVARYHGKVAFDD